LETDALQDIIKSLNRDLEEKRVELSRLRLLADAMGEGIQDPDYFNRVCMAINQILNASITAIFWVRKRVPAGWWLGAWSSKSPRHYPLQSIIPNEQDESLGASWKEQRPLWVNDPAGETIVKMWGFAAGETPPIALIPLKANGLRSGMLIIIDPVLNVNENHRQQHLEMIQVPVNAGIFNRLLYKNRQDSEEELRDLFDNASDMVVVAYHDGIIRDCNRAFIETLGLEGDPRGQRLAEMIVEERGNILDEVWVRLLSGEVVRNVDVRLRGADGKMIDAELSGSARTLLSGRPGIIRLYMRDLSERREAERRQRELELEVELANHRKLAQVGLYVSGIAHNLQNPVQVLLGYISLLRDKGSQIEELGELEKSTQRIMGIIQNLLQKMRQEQSTAISSIDLNELLNNELTFLDANLFYKHQVEKQYSFDDSLPPVRGVYSDFSQSIMNIVYNALEAMTEAKERILGIRTSFDPETECAIIEISDTGFGIPEQVQQRIFEPFFSTKRNGSGGSPHDLHGGTGLGLSSSLALLKPYGGSIEFDSNPENGTTFRLHIPVQGGPQ